MSVPVLHLIWALTPGGAERQAVELAQGLHGNEFSVSMACMSEKGAFAEELEQAGIEVLCLHKRSRVDLAFLRSLTRVLKERQIQILHAHMFTASLWGRLAARRARVPVVISHEHSTHTLDCPLRRLLDRCLLSRVQRIVTVAPDLETRFMAAGYPAAKLHTIPNGIQIRETKRSAAETRAELGLATDAAVVIVVGALEPRKDHATLLRALPALRARIGTSPDIALLVVGDGPLRASLETGAAAVTGVEVHFLGLRQDVPDLLAAADVYVSSSVTEGTSIALLEAMAAGVSVVATAVGGTPEVVGETGLLCPASDPQALAQALHACLADREAAAARAARAQERVVREYTLAAMLQRFRDLYQQCLQERGV